ncbi:MAG: hypothetical protein QOJ85_4608 [Solirubrobacteraceae bacterium]|nr:hypothetical protein [Solirubrobacteraceae bacterium]
MRPDGRRAAAALEPAGAPAAAAVAHRDAALPSRCAPGHDDAAVGSDDRRQAEAPRRGDVPEADDRPPLAAGRPHPRAEAALACEEREHAVAARVHRDRGRAGEREIARRRQALPGEALADAYERRALVRPRDDRLTEVVGRRPGVGGVVVEDAERAEAAVGPAFGDDEAALARARRHLTPDEQGARLPVEVDLGALRLDAGEIRRPLPATGRVARRQAAEDRRGTAAQRAAPAQQPVALGVEAQVVQPRDALRCGDRLELPGRRARRRRRCADHCHERWQQPALRRAKG